MPEGAVSVGGVVGTGLAGAILLVSAVGCSCEGRTEKGASTPTPPSDPAVVHGFAVHGHEVRSFRPCGSSEDLWAVDSTGALWELHQELAFPGTLYPELYVVVEGRSGPPPASGFGTDYAATMVVSRVLHMAAEGDRCGVDPAQVRVLAQGNEPFWNLSLTTESLSFHRLGHPREVWQDVLGGWEGRQAWFRAEANSAQDEGPTLWVLPPPCRDDMSGSYFHASARVIWKGEALTGCAWMPAAGSPNPGRDPPGA